MQIDPDHPANPLRLVRPPEQAQPASKPQPAREARQAEQNRPADSMNFEAVYRANLPRVPYTDAHQRLERIRSELVGATTDVPIHFDSPGATSDPAGGNNPYASSYMKLAPAPVDRNASATEQQADHPAE